MIPLIAIGGQKELFFSIIVYTFAGALKKAIDKTMGTYWYRQESERFS